EVPPAEQASDGGIPLPAVLADYRERVGLREEVRGGHSNGYTSRQGARRNRCDQVRTNPVKIYVLGYDGLPWRLAPILADGNARRSRRRSSPPAGSRPRPTTS